MLDKIWHKTRRIVQHKNSAQQCYVTIYSNQKCVIDSVVDTYLDRTQDFKTLLDELRSGEHALMISKDLNQATKRLIRLKRHGKLADIDGAACHLVANIRPAILQRLIDRKKDFRRFLSEVDGFALELTPALESF